MSIHHLNVEFVKKSNKLWNVVKFISAVSLITCTAWYLKMIKYDELLCLNVNHGFTRYQYSKVVSAHLTHMQTKNVLLHARLITTASDAVQLIYFITLIVTHNFVMLPPR